MLEFMLDGQDVDSRATLHRLFAQGFNLPEYYGANLDALFDFLGDIGNDTLITIRNWRQLDASLGDYAMRLMALLWRASRENPHIRLCISSDE